jgi:hypothetical protein
MCLPKRIAQEKSTFRLKLADTQTRLVNWISAREMAALPNAASRTALLLPDHNS